MAPLLAQLSPPTKQKQLTRGLPGAGQLGSLVAPWWCGCGSVGSCEGQRHLKRAFQVPAT
jgi:hypothetical protein